MIGIKGDSTRGWDVIKFLKKIGGKEDTTRIHLWPIDGSDEGMVYFIGDDCTIDACSINASVLLKQYDITQIYSLQEIEKKYPYNLYDKVCIVGGPGVHVITHISLCNDDIYYILDNGSKPYTIDKLRATHATFTSGSIFNGESVITLKDVEDIAKMIDCDHSHVDINVILNIINTIKDLK